MRKPVTMHRRMNSIVGAISIAVFMALPFTIAAQSHAKAQFSGDKKAIERLFAAWNSHDVEKVVAAFSNSAVYEDVAAGDIHKGRDQIRKWVTSAFRDIENFKLTVVRSTYYKGTGLVEWVWSGTDKGLFKTDKTFSVRGVSVIEVRRGKISRYQEYYDFATIMRQLGVLPVAKE